MLLVTTNHLPYLHFLKFTVIKKEFSNIVQIFNHFAYREHVTRKLGNIKDKENLKLFERMKLPLLATDEKEPSVILIL